MRARHLIAPLAATTLLAPAGARLDEHDTPASDPAREEIVVRGVRTGSFRHEPTASKQVVFADDFEAERKSLADLLSETEGVFVRRFGGAGDPAEVSIRGSSANQVVVSIDGVRSNSALTGGLDLSSVCLPLVDRVEISRGGGATREGSGAVGGAINIVTRGAPESGEPVHRVGGSGGSFDTWEGSAFRAGSLESLDYNLGYCGFSTQGDYEFARPVFVGPDGIPSPFLPSTATRINNDRVRHGATLGLGGPVGPGTLRFTDFLSTSEGGEPGIDCCNGVDAGQNREAHSED